MTPCQPRILYQQHRICVARCAHCGHVTLRYGNLIAGFAPSDFDRYCRNVLPLDFDTYCATTPDEEAVVVLQTCHPNIQFAFNRNEFAQLKSALAESQLLLQAHHVLEQNQLL